MIDLDFVKYAIASVGETRSIVVTHIPSGKQQEFKTRTEFYGHHAKKSGGWLKERNLERETKALPLFAVDEFSIEDKQEVTEPIENVLHSAKQMVDGVVAQSGATSYVALAGKGDSFRVELSTLLKYKGNRDHMLKPLLIQQVTDYLSKKYNAKIITGIEVDDAATIYTYENKDSFITGNDKDYRGAGTKFFDAGNPDEGIIDCSGFGSLWDTGKKISGKGRLFKYFQVLGEDSSDNYAANCFSDIKWAEKSAYKALKDCQSDADAFSVLRDSFEKLYPEPKIITGWRGNQFEIDWLYVLQECFNMAHLHRWENDFIDVWQVMKKLGVV